MFVDLSKEEKEKLKKAISKCRNILRKLLRHSATLGHGSGEYGIVTADEVEQICASCDMDDLNEMNNSMGGEPASKDQNLVVVAGFEVVKSKLVSVRAKSLEAAEDEQIAKDAKKREQAEKLNTKKPKATNGNPEEKAWTEDQISALKTCLKRYPAGSANRWVNIMNYVNVKTDPAVSFTQDEIVMAAYRMSK